MEAEKDMMAIGDSSLVEADTSPNRWYSSNLVEKMQSITLDFHVESTGVGFPRYSLEDDLSPQTASQMLWELGSFDCRIPNGFYSVIPNKILKERFDTIPSPEELRALGPEGIGADALLVDSERDKKLEKLKEFTVASVKGLSSNPALMIKKIAEVVYDFYGGPISEAGPAKYLLDNSSTSADNLGVQLLGKVKNGLCRPRAILFKVLADAIGLRSRLLVGLQVYDRVILDAETCKHMSLLVGLNSTELLVDMMRSPGQLIPLSRRALIMYHFSGTGESDSADNDSCDSPLEPGSPMFGFSDKFDSESPEHSFPRARGRSMLSGHRQSFVDDADSVSASSPDQSPQHGVGVGRASVIRRRSISSLHSSGENERAVRAMNETIKREGYIMKGQGHGGRERDIFNDHGDEDVDSHKSRNELKSNMGDHKDASTTKEIEHDYEKNIGESTQKTMLVPLSQGQLERSQSTRVRSVPLEATDLITSWNQVVQSTSLECNSFLPFPEWNIDPDELKIGIRVGIGSFGEVFRGIWRGTDVAIKVLLEQDLTMENMEDFCNEISLLSRLRHPNVILFLGACTTPPHLSMVTEYMHKGSLYHLLHTSGQGKKLSWRRRLKMLRDICRGMMCIQRMNIVHRDLKSANCLVDKHWTVKICDFGLSQIMTSSPLRDSKAAGTPEWMAPELLRSESFTEKCDIFSLGVIMWELCTLKRPWDGVKPMQVVYAVAHEGARLDIPEGPIGKLISDCWADDPDARPCYEEIFTRLHECEFLVS